MQKEVWYNRAVAGITMKKTEQLAMKLLPETFEKLSLIAEVEDRPVGYVARELMLRGMVLYAVDGNLRDTYSPHHLEEIMHKAVKAAIPKGEVAAKISGNVSPTKDDVRRMLSMDRPDEKPKPGSRQLEAVPVLKEKAK